jgi:hypothetical protein
MQGWFLRTKAFDLQSFLIGYTLGIAGKPLPLTASKPGSEPVAYLYNGVRLPKLPEWDLPYAYIGNFATGYSGYHLDQRPYSKNDGYYYIPNGTKIREYKLTDEAWVTTGEHVWEYEYAETDCNTLVWASFDILNTDGTICFAASKPIPVYE